MLPFNEIGLVKRDEKKVDENVKHQHLLAHEFFFAHILLLRSYLEEIVLSFSSGYRNGIRLHRFRNDDGFTIFFTLNT
jgi:hypothetical protein